MTSARRQRKARRNLLRLALAGAATAWMRPLGVNAATTERVVSDRYSGLAIDGYDPVAYFIDSSARPGQPRYEHRHAGVVWRFCNAGNQAAFTENPETYMPSFGGYDPVGVARGVATAGNPLVWLVSEDRLCLFYNPAAREQFLANPKQMLVRADSKWPDVLGSLVP
jgi:YHS domain-containing protein